MCIVKAVGTQILHKNHLKRLDLLPTESDLTVGSENDR